MFQKRKKYLIIIGLVFLILYILPNMLNFRERKYFSDENRREEAAAIGKGRPDSVNVVPGEFYRRGKGYTYFFGLKNRELWTTPVKAAVFNYDSIGGGLVPYEAGGSQQTISIRLRDSAGRHWVLRSVNKDQQNVLPWWLRASILRPVFRDQVAAMNPYAAKLVSVLSAAAELPHLSPRLFWVPDVPEFGEYNQRIAGRLVYLEPLPDKSWLKAPEFGQPLQILDGEELAEKLEKKQAVIDTLLYLRTRLFDMLVNDWDRHKDQWRWLLTEVDGRQMLRPLARDRDIAFYVFDDGLISKAAIRANEKFQSFHEEFESVAGLMKQSSKQDRDILKGLPRDQYLAMARQLQQSITPGIVATAFRQYPPAIYQRFGKSHESILLSRLGQLPAVATEFHRLINAD